jgi:hypothetical protein
MSVLRTYTVLELAQKTENLMNVLYSQEWEEEMSANNSDEFLFKKIKNMHARILTDSNINTMPNGNSCLFNVAARLSCIERALTGTNQETPGQISVKYLINRTKGLISDLSVTQREYLCVIC